MTTIKTVDQLFDAIEYYPMQIDLNKHLFRYYKQLEDYPDFYSNYQYDYIDGQLITFETIKKLAVLDIFQDRKLSQDLLNVQDEFKFNVLNAFKLYVLLQENMKKK